MNIHPKIKTTELSYLYLDLDKNDVEIVKALDNIFYPKPHYDNDELQRNLDNREGKLTINLFHIFEDYDNLSTDINVSIYIRNNNPTYSYILTKQQIKTYLFLKELSELNISEYINDLFYKNEIKEIT